MPTTKFQKVVFALITVVITVNLFVFYNLAIEMGGMSNQVFIAAREVVATIMYNGITVEFLAQWMQKIVFNLPFAFFTQLFFIQPFVRFVFRNIFKSQLNKNNQYAVN